MKRKIDIQKVDGYGNGRKNCMVSVKLELDNGKFSSCADLWRWDYSDIITGGQCFDSLLEDFPELKDNVIFMEVYDLWNNYHLNDMHAGTPEQEKAIEEWQSQGNKYDYEKACEYLKSKGLYEVSTSTIDKEANPKYKNCEEKIYKYGHDWLKESIPDKDLERIKSLIETGLVKEDLHKQEDLELEM